jgi:hydrogenase-4 component B
MTSQALLAVALYLLLSLVALLGARARVIHALVYAACFLIALALVALGLSLILGGSIGRGYEEVLPVGLPWLKAHFRLDSLSALFLVVVNLGAAAASLFGIGYGTHLERPGRVTPLFPLFLAGMNGAVLADDAFVFLVSWEFMSFSSWLLVLAEHEKEENRKAAFTYLVMAVLGTFCLLSAFGILAMAGGDYSFSAMRTGSPGEAGTALVVLLAILGAGSKAGLVPLHAWLPLAHPAAPSHVSALMSGVMTKVALYGMVRILFDLVHGADWWWGAVMMGLGAATAVIGILYALMQTDLKRLLAYSTVENVGVAMIGLGLAFAFRAEGQTPFATLALAAAFYHILNHAMMKSLLFLGAGAVLAATGERDIEKLGGLIHRMPVTAATFLIGAAAISSLPPLNGFVSEWLILQTLFIGPSLPHWAMKFGVPVVGAVVALSATLAAAAMVRAFGMVFLGRARTEAARNAKDAGLPERATLIFLAGFCLLLGILPVTVTSLLSDVAQFLIGVQLPTAVIQGWPWLAPVSETRGSYSGTVVVGSGVILILLTVILIKGFGTRRIRRSATWDCGHPENNLAAQYTASSFAQPLRRVFGSTAFAAHEEVDMPMPGETRPARLEVRMIDPIWLWLYEPVIRAVDVISRWLDRLQTLTVRKHLLLVFLTLMILLVIVALRRVG